MEESKDYIIKNFTVSVNPDYYIELFACEQIFSKTYKKYTLGIKHTEIQQRLTMSLILM